MDNLKEKAFVFASIFTLSNKLQVLGDKLDENMTTKQWLLLAGIANSGGNTPTISEVADLIGNSRQNVKKMALILEKAGFLKMEKDTNDARVLRISLTDKCLDYLKLREKKELEFLQQLFNGFDTNLIKGLEKGILKLGGNIIEMEKQYEEK
jgi:DNA-binding MarR family transcriptional regulator